jgi:hypothetical protein
MLRPLLAQLWRRLLLRGQLLRRLLLWWRRVLILQWRLLLLLLQLQWLPLSCHLLRLFPQQPVASSSSARALAECDIRILPAGSARAPAAAASAAPASG